MQDELWAAFLDQRLTRSSVPNVLERSYCLATLLLVVVLPIVAVFLSQCEFAQQSLPSWGQNLLVVLAQLNSRIESALKNRAVFLKINFFD